MELPINPLHIQFLTQQMMGGLQSATQVTEEAAEPAPRVTQSPPKKSPKKFRHARNWDEDEEDDEDDDEDEEEEEGDHEDDEEIVHHHDLQPTREVHNEKQDA